MVGSATVRDLNSRWNNWRNLPCSARICPRHISNRRKTGARVVRKKRWRRKTTAIMNGAILIRQPAYSWPQRPRFLSISKRHSLHIPLINNTLSSFQLYCTVNHPFSLTDYYSASIFYLYTKSIRIWFLNHTRVQTIAREDSVRTDRVIVLSTDGANSQMKTFFCYLLINLHLVTSVSTFSLSLYYWFWLVTIFRLVFLYFFRHHPALWNLRLSIVSCAFFLLWNKKKSIDIVSKVLRYTTRCFAVEKLACLCLFIKFHSNF